MLRRSECDRWFCQQILRLFGVIAYAVIGTVGHHAVRRFLSGFGFGQRAGADFFLQGFRLHFLRVDWPDNAVTVTAWHHIYRFGPSEDQPLLDGFMAVTIQYNDIIIRHTGLHNSTVRTGGPDNHGPGAVSTEYAGGVFLAFAKRAGMVEE